MVREYLECNNIYTSVDGSLLRIFICSHLKVNAHLPSQALIPLIPENELDCILVAGLPRPGNSAFILHLGGSAKTRDSWI
jgi:hypothetical protein